MGRRALGGSPALGMRAENDVGVRELIAVQATATPNAVAVIAGAGRTEERVTYAELMTRVHRLAHALRAAGVRRETLVGVGCERSIDMVVAVLAVISAGGAYVPLDPAYPDERLRFMVRDAELELILTQRAVGARFGATEASCLCVDDAAAFDAHPDTAPSVELEPDDPIVVLYTSGSTGRPKGVVCLHRAITNRLQWAQAVFPYQPGEVAAARTPLGFVDSVAEILAPLAFGVPLVIVGTGLQLEPAAMLDELAAHEVSRIVVVPSLLATWLDVVPDAAARAPRLRYWFVGGEPVPVPLVAAFQRLLPGRKLINIYGATELSGDATYFDFDAMPVGLSTSPIGTALSGVYVHIVDDRLAEVPVGEVCVAGACLARGYLGQPELTRERFVANPFPEGGMLYRTGDRGRWLPDGGIQYLGRSGGLIKIRGNRVELGEVEARLGELPELGQVAVVARSDPGGEPQLIAFYDGERQPAAALRAHLCSRVPEYMVPARFVALPALPVNAHGKLDRHALRELPVDDAALAGDGPVGLEEQRLAEIWSEILGCEVIGRSQSFYDLGGSSLAAVRLVARLRDELRLKIPIAAVFAHPTVAELAAYLGRLGAQRGIASSRMRISGRPLPPVLPLSHCQLPFWLFRALTGDVSVVNEVFGFEAGPGRALDLHRLQAAFARTVASFDALWMRHPRWRPVQCLADRRDVGFEVVDHRSATAPIDALVLAEAERNSTRRFDLERPPLVHARLIRLPGGDDRLLVAIPHVAVDMTGMELFRARLQACYAGAATAPDRNAASLADLVAWERAGIAADEDASYWDGVGRGAATNPIPVRLCTGLMGGRPTRAFSARSIDPEHLAQLARFAQQHAVTVPIVLIAALHAGVARAFEIDEPTLLLMVEKRDRAEIRTLFTSLAGLMRFRLRGGAALLFDERVRRTGEQLLASYAHSDHLMRRPTLFNDFWHGVPRPVRRAVRALSATAAGRWPDAELDPDALAEYVFAIVPRSARRPAAGAARRDILICVNIMPEVTTAEPPATGGFRVVRARTVDQILRPGDLLVGTDALLDRTLQIHLARDRAGKVVINLYGGGLDQRGLDSLQERTFEVLEAVVGDSRRRVGA